MEFKDNNEKVNSLTWHSGEVILDLYEVRPVVEGLGDTAAEKSCHRGGFGQVYKVYHRGWNLELAMKAPLPGVFENEAQIEDFTRECETWVGLGLHPHIVTCYYVRQLEGQPLVFADYVNGGSLKEWIDSGLLYNGGPEEALKKILDIAIQTARGLSYAHDQGLLHQDIKPANVLLTPEGQAKVSDFGTARARARAAAGTVTVSPGTILVSRGGMTPAYCSPEQSLGEKLTRRTDIWSWGLMVLEMFAGEVTWASGVAAAQALEAYLKHVGDAAEIPPMPRELSLLLERCFRSEQERPQNFGQITSELMQIYRSCCGSDYPRKEPKAAGDYAGSLNNRALSMHDLGYKEDAIKLWEKALQHDHNYLPATYNLGMIQWRSGRITSATLIQRLEGLLKGQPSARLKYLLAMVHIEGFDYCSAVKLLEEVNAVENADYEAGVMLKRLKPLESEGAMCLRTFEGHTHDVNSVCLSLDNRYALSGSRDRTLKLWELESGRCLRTFEGHTDFIESVCLSADGRYGLSGSEDNTLKLWELESGRCLRTFEGHTSTQYIRGSVTSVCLSTDSRFALSGGRDETLKLWEVESGRCLRTFEGHTRSVNSACLSADDRYALSGGDDMTVKLWEVESGKCLRTFEGHEDSVLSVCLSSDGRYALSGSFDDILKLWEVESGRCLRTFEGHTSFVASVCLSSDDRYALSGSYDNTLKLWEVESGRCLRTFEGHTDGVHSVCLSADGRYALSGSYDDTLKPWFIPWTEAEIKLFTAQLEASPAVNTDDILATEQAFDEYLAEAQRALQSGEVNQALLVLRAARALPSRFRDLRFLNMWATLYPKCSQSAIIDSWLLRTFELNDRFVTSVCLSSDFRYALSGSSIGKPNLWEVASGKCLRTFEGHTGTVTSICLSADGCYALSGSWDKTLKLWEMKSGRCLRTFEGHTDGVHSVCLSTDGRYALSGGEDMTLQHWDVKSGRWLRTFEGHTGTVTSVCLSADGRYALSGSWDKTLKLWELKSGRCLRTFKGHTNAVNSVCLSSDGRYALSGSYDYTLKLWEVESGKCLRTFEGHTNSVSSICLSSDDRYGLSGSGDGTLKLWELKSGRCLRTFKGHEGSVESVCLSADNRFALSNDAGKTLRLWELYWEMEDPIN